MSAGSAVLIRPGYRHTTGIHAIPPPLHALGAVLIRPGYLFLCRLISAILDAHYPQIPKMLGYTVGVKP